MKQPRKVRDPKIPRPRVFDDVEEPTDRKSLSLVQEKRLSVELGFKLTKGSGNQQRPSQKGDGQTDRVVYELKRAKGSSITVSEQVIAKVCKEAAHMGKEPVLVVTLDGIARHLPRDWALVPAGFFRDLLGEDTFDGKPR